MRKSLRRVVSKERARRLQWIFHALEFTVLLLCVGAALFVNGVFNDQPVYLIGSTAVLVFLGVL